MKISLNWLTDYLDVNLPAAELGELFTQIGLNCDGIEETDADIVYDLEVTSNRPDLLGHLGVARELAAALRVEFRPPVIGDLPTEGRAAELTQVTVEAPDLCPRYTARVLRGVKVGPSPAWLVERLEAVGLRSVNNVVDVTNFVLMEYSQPLHSFDYDKLAGRRIVVRRARPGEQLVSIDQTTCRLDEAMLVIADAEKPVAIAGIMGGLNTEVGDETVNVLIESARFDPLNTRRTSRKLGLMSDSNYRFERGVDPVRLDEASLRACQLILQIAGGTLAEGVVDVWANPFQAPRVSLRPRRTCTLLGIDVPAERQVEVLDRLGLQPAVEDGTIACTIPSHRADLTREVDLIEEVARMVGFDQIPTAGRMETTIHREGPVQKTRRRLGETLTACGYDEALTFSFLDRDEAAAFGYDRTVDVDPLVRRTNNTLRPTVLPSLLTAMKTNQDAGTADVHLFELSSVFRPTAREQLPEEFDELALVSSGDLRDLRGTLETLAARLLPGAVVTAAAQDVAGFEPGSAATLTLNEQPWGHLGIVAAKVQDRWGLEKPVAAAAVRFAPLLAGAQVVRVYEPVAKFPPVRRDLSLVVDEALPWRDLAEAIEAVDQPLRTGLDYVTTYRGKQAGEGRKSVTVALTYRSSEGTLRREQVDEQVAEVVEAIGRRFGATLRG